MELTDVGLILNELLIGSSDNFEAKILESYLFIVSLKSESKVMSMLY